MFPAALEGSPIVDAEAVVPLGLAARSASAQVRAEGREAEPTGSERLVVNQRDFDEWFFSDIDAAVRRVVIYSPFLTHNRLEAVGPHLRAAVARGVEVFVVTKSLSGRGKRELPAYRELMRILSDWGAIVVPKKAMHEKLVFVDEDVVWVGSLNPLSFRDTREIMERRRSPAVASDYRKTLKLDIAFEAYGEGGDGCPVCGAEIALAEGQYGPYCRCVIPGCYSRGLSDPPLVKGRMVCHTCGGRLYYGSWGEEPHWRCHDNKRHRMKVHPNHLRLPAMAGMLTQAERRALSEHFERIGWESEAPGAAGTGEGRLFD